MQDIETLLNSVKIPEYWLQRFLKVDKTNVIMNDDGYYVYWPIEPGYHTDFDLFWIAAYLYQKNKPWDDEVKAYFATQQTN